MPRTAPPCFPEVQYVFNRLRCVSVPLHNLKLHRCAPCAQAVEAEGAAEALQIMHAGQPGIHSGADPDADQVCLRVPLGRHKKSELCARRREINSCIFTASVRTHGPHSNIEASTTTRYFAETHCTGTAAFSYLI